MKSLTGLIGIITLCLFLSCKESSTNSEGGSEQTLLSSSMLALSSSSSIEAVADLGIGVWRVSTENHILSFIIHRTEKGLQIQYQEEKGTDTVDYHQIAFNLKRTMNGYEFNLSGEGLEFYTLVLNDSTNSGTFTGGYFQTGILTRVSEPKECNSDCYMGVCDLVNGVCNDCKNAESCKIECSEDVDCTGAFGGWKCNTVTGYCQTRCDEDSWGCMWGTECMADGFCSYQNQYTTDWLK